MSKIKEQRGRGRPRLEGGPELKILNCKVPLDVKIQFDERATAQGFSSSSAKLRKLVVDDLKKPEGKKRAE